MTGAVRSRTNKRALKAGLEKLYRTFDRSMLSPDPLECVPAKGRKNDIELCAFIAASFAYGKADLIVRNVRFIIDELGPNRLKPSFRTAIKENSRAGNTASTSAPTLCGFSAG